jgi:hypothetical protein
MAKNKISEYSSTASNNTDIAGINISEGCAPSGINNAIRELMAQLKDQQAGTDGDGFVVGGAFTSSGGAVFSSGTTFSGSVVMSAAVTMSNNVIMSGTTNTIGTTTSSTIISGSVTQTSGSVLYLDAAATTSAAPPLSWSGDTNTGIYRPAADTLALVTGGSERFRINSSGVLIIGSGEATTSVSGNVLRAPSASGTNITGANLEIQAGNGTGTGGSGNIVLKTAAAGSSGSTANTLTQRLLITKNGGFSFGSGATDYGTVGQVLKSNGDAPPTFGSTITFGTLQSLSGTSTDFTSIPSWVKRITILIDSAVTSANSQYAIQVITASGAVTTGYTGGASSTASGSTGYVVSSGTRFPISFSSVTTNTSTIQLSNITSNKWVLSSTGGTNSGSTAVTNTATGSVDAGDTLTGIRITTVAGTATFNSGTANIIYE